MTPARQLDHKIWRIAWPMILSNLSVPFLGLADAAILGHLEHAGYLSAVAVGGSLLSFLYWGFGFLRMGTTGLAAQAVGANQHDRGVRILAQSMLLGLAIAAVILISHPLLLEWGLALLDPPAGSEALAAEYTRIRVFSAPAVLVNYAIIGWLIGHQDTRWPLLIMVTTNLLNILLDLWLVVGLDLNSRGAAIATLVAEYSGLLLALWVVRRYRRRLPGRLDWNRLWHWTDYRRLLQVNQHLFVRTLVLLACFAFFTAQGARQGETMLAANALLLQLLLLVSHGLDGFAHAAEALVGDAAGRRDRRLLLAICRRCAVWSLVTALLFTAAYAVGGTALLGLLTSLPEVHQATVEYLPWLLALPIAAMASYLLDGIFIGTTQTRAMQYTMLMSALLVYLPVWYLSQGLGNHGLWLAFVSFNAARGVLLGYCFVQRDRRRAWWPERAAEE